MLCLSFPPLTVLCIVLRLDDFFLQGKAVSQTAVEYEMGERNIVLSFSRVAKIISLAFSCRATRSIQ